MILKAYSIYDNKALSYNAPWFTHTDGAAVRSLRDLVNEPNNNVSRHPGDFVMYCVGEFDDQTGIFTLCSPLRHVMDAQALVELPPNTDGSQRVFDEFFKKERL